MLDHRFHNSIRHELPRFDNRSGRIVTIRQQLHNNIEQKPTTYSVMSSDASQPFFGNKYHFSTFEFKPPSLPPMKRSRNLFLIWLGIVACFPFLFWIVSKFIMEHEDETEKLLIQLSTLNKDSIPSYSGEK
jgi:hypothetical protein